MRDRILLLRKELKISQSKLAEDLSLSRTFINLYENGNREISERTISDICRIYNVNEEWLRNGTGDMFKPLDKETEISLIAKRLLKSDNDDFFSKFVKVLAQLNENELELLRSITKKLAEIEKDSSL